MLEEFMMSMRGLLDDHQDLCLIPYDVGTYTTSNNDNRVSYNRVSYSIVRILLCAKDWQSPNESVILSTVLVNSFELKFARPNNPLEDHIPHPFVKSSRGELLGIMRSLANCIMLMGYSVWLPRASDIKIHQAYYDQEKEFEAKGMHFAEFKPCREVDTDEYVICNMSDLVKLFEPNFKECKDSEEIIAAVEAITKPKSESEENYWRKIIGDETMIDKPEVDKNAIKIVASDEETSAMHSATVTFTYTVDRSVDKSVDINADNKPWWKFW